MIVITAYYNNNNRTLKWQCSIQVKNELQA